MSRSLAYLLIGLLALAPTALAQEEKPAEPSPDEEPARPDDAAWVEDCPPDMMCAAGAEEPQDGPTYGDCGGEVCAYDGEPGSFGPEDCIECSRPPQDNVSRGPEDGSCDQCRGDEPVSDTCMDGAAEHEICDRDVQYLDGGSGRPAIDTESADAAKSVPGASFVLVVAALALAIFVAARRA